MMINVAIVGAGAISGFHIEGYLAFPDRCRIISVTDSVPDRARQQIARYQLDAVAGADPPDRGVDLASVCTPPGTHAQIACDLLAAGIHTLCEKPMAVSLAECDAMIAAAARSGAVLSVVAQNRFTTPMARLRALLGSGLAGRVLHAQVDSHWWRGPSYYDLWWRGTWQSEGGGCTLNHAVHHVDALRWMLGEPAEIAAMFTNLAHENAEVEDLSVALLRFSSGAFGQITSSVLHHAQDQRIVFQTDRASVAMPWAVRASVQLPNGFPERDAVLERELDECYQSLPEPVFQGHTGQIDDVLTAIESGGGQVAVDGAAGRGTLEIITGIYKAAITGTRVALPLDGSDPFRTKDGLLAAAPRFHSKRVSVAAFATDEITTTGGVA